MTDIPDKDFVDACIKAREEGITAENLGISHPSYDWWAEGKHLPKQFTRRAVLKEIERIRKLRARARGIND
jgi:hypothetical protein